MAEIVFDYSSEGILKAASFYCNDIHEKIFTLPLELGIGNLQNGVLSDARYQQIHSWFSDDPWLADECFFDEGTQKEHTEMVKTCFEQLEEENEIRIWYDYSANSFCGFLHFISMIKEKNCEVHAVCLNDHPKYRLQYNGLGGAEPDIAIDLLRYGISLSTSERRYIEKEWELIEQVPSSLRVCLNGRIIPVPEDFFDNYIYYYIPKTGPFNAHKLVGEILSDTTALDYYALSWRISTILHKICPEPEKKLHIQKNAPTLAKYIFNINENDIPPTHDTAFYDWANTPRHYTPAGYQSTLYEVVKMLKEEGFEKTAVFQTIGNLSYEQLKYVHTYLHKAQKNNGKLTLGDLRAAHALAVRNV